MHVERVPVDVETRGATGGTSAYVVGESESLLVDPAAASDRLDEVTVDHLAVTHHHHDHTGAVERYAGDDVTVWARTGRVEAFRLATGVDPDRTFRDGTVIPVAGGVDVVDTPGHAPEHVAFAADSELLSGDLAVANGSVVVGAPSGDVRAYLSSLRRVHARGPDRMLPSHGPVIENPRATCQRLIDHRLDRERRILTAVRDGVSTIDDLVDAVYQKDLTGVRDLARATVVAHVEKLAVEGAVTRDGDHVSAAGL